MTSPHSGCWQRPNDKVGYPAGYLCRPLAAYAGEGTPPECAECDKSWNKQWATGSGWRAEVARFEAARHPRVTVLPAAALTSSLWDFHVGTMPSPDCTHFCLLPPLVEAFAHHVVELRDVSEHGLFVLGEVLAVLELGPVLVLTLQPGLALST